MFLPKADSCSWQNTSSNQIFCFLETMPIGPRESRRGYLAISFCTLHINTNQIIFVYIVQTNHMSHYLQLTVGRQHSVFISVCLYFIVIKQECTESLHEPSLIYTYSEYKASLLLVNTWTLKRCDVVTLWRCDVVRLWGWLMTSAAIV